MLIGSTEAPLDADASTTRCAATPDTRSALAGAGPLWRPPSALQGSPPRAHAGTTWDTTSASGGNLAPGRRRRSSGHPPRQTEPRERCRRIGSEPSRLGGQLPAALRRKPVVPAQAALDDLLPVDTDQAVEAQTVQGRIQGPGAQPHPSVRDRCDVGDDPVAVLAARSQRREDQEGRLLHRPLGHIRSIYRRTVECVAELGLPLRLPGRLALARSGV